MDQLNQHKQRFDLLETSIVRAQLTTKHDNQIKTEQETDQISIFDAAKYFSGVHDDHNHNPRRASLNVPSSPKVIVEVASMARLSSVSSTIDNQSNYRARSFHATPTASSEASWNSQTGLLANPPGSLGINIHNFSPNSKTTSNINSRTNTTTWQRINPKWLIHRRKCPCSGRKSVQVEERIDSRTPRMVDLRRSYSSNSPQLPIVSQGDHGNFGLNNLIMARKLEPINNIRKHSNGYSSSSSNLNSIVPSKLGNVTTNSTNSLAKTSVVVNGGTTSSNGFTFPILEDEPVAVKKMFFNVITPENNNQTEPNRDSLEVFQPRSIQSPRSRRMSYEEDNVSDGSSDLFEIESFSTSTYPRQRDSMDEAVVTAHYNSSIKRFGIVCPNNDLVIKTGTKSGNPVLLCRNSLDENDEPSVSPTECYAPSEVSIDWSVTTAEGFDKASLTNFSVSASEIGYVAMRRESEKNSRGASRGVERKNGGGLLSCRCEKAVSVGPGPIKCPIEGGPPIPIKHVGGGLPKYVGQGQLGGANHANGTKAGLVVGRSRTSLVGVPFAT